ncbi:hypothetical protein T440DRAFT_320149 [Plenodomus tracheiphilus IPT5]|uniref:Uncharacterized protein n=1 Tax=Plenodomus tracheiphilus IPT5 TaxID=1408161 RepID=A0A6A7BCT5_9PLEO|nr:hypothetical protein T440DRAFT_320149 [Plenodomus tracheiphilus IPT5]
MCMGLLYALMPNERSITSCVRGSFDGTSRNRYLFQKVTNIPDRWNFHAQSFIPRTVRYAPVVEYTYDNTDDTPVSRPNNDMNMALFPFFYDQNGTHPWTTDNSSQAEIPIRCSTSTACGYFLNATSQAPVLMSGYRLDSSQAMSRGETLLMRTLPLVTDPLRMPIYVGSINFRHIDYPILDALIVSSADGTADSVYRKEVSLLINACLSGASRSFNSSGTEDNIKKTS